MKNKKVEITNADIDTYCHTHSFPESAFLKGVFDNANLFFPQAMMSSNRLSGGFLRTLTAMKQPKNILEVGLFFGYSTLCMAEGAPNASITSLEWDGRYVELAKDVFDAHPCSNHITVIQGDASKTITEQMERQQFDFIFIDADKQSYQLYVEKAIEHLSVGGTLVVDNTLFGGRVLNAQEDGDMHAISIDTVNTLLCEHPQMINVLVPIRDGMHVAVKV